eukprot:TRINITY_DN44584_c0_g1_i1.p1 TRINITY_DN44584_c0_g1~~TRINITY_DN44584_c0_g1_i1.p1  ORF type:complete len:478 (+),score=64.53 TRINITY_DN44584_c0_g1_i1:41-1474(+)
MMVLRSLTRRGLVQVKATFKTSYAHPIAHRTAVIATRTHGSAGDSTRWPLLAGGFLTCGIVTAGVALQFDVVLKHFHRAECIERQPGGTNMEPRLTAHGLLRIFAANALAALPADDLKLALLRNGALSFWAWVLSSDSLEQDLTASASLNELLTGDAAVAAFHQESELYDILANAVMTSLRSPEDDRQDSSSAEQVRMKLMETLTLSGKLVAHPRFAELGDDSVELGVWEDLIRRGFDEMQTGPELILPWSMLVAGAAQRPCFARWVLADRPMTKRLLLLAEYKYSEKEVAAMSKDVLVVIEVQRDIATLALHRLAKNASSDGAERVLIGWDRYLDEYLDVVPPCLPSSLPRQKGLEKRAWIDIAMCAAGGLLWGGLRGIPARLLSQEQLWRNIVLTSLGSATCQVFMETSAEIHKRLDPEPTYSKLRNYLSVSSIDVGLSFSILWITISQIGARYAFGGWILGQIAYLSALTCADR